MNFKLHPSSMSHPKTFIFHLKFLDQEKTFKDFLAITSRKSNVRVLERDKVEQSSKQALQANTNEIPQFKRGGLCKRIMRTSNRSDPLDLKNSAGDRSDIFSTMELQNIHGLLLISPGWNSAYQTYPIVFMLIPLGCVT